MSNILRHSSFRESLSQEMKLELEDESEEAVSEDENIASNCQVQSLDSRQSSQGSMLQNTFH